MGGRAHAGGRRAQSRARTRRAAQGGRQLMPARRSYGTGSIIERNSVYYGKWWTHDRQVMRRIGRVRTPHLPDGLTKTQAEARLRDLIADAQAAAPVEHARTLQAAADAWLAHLEAN